MILWLPRYARALVVVADMTTRADARRTAFALRRALLPAYLRLHAAARVPALRTALYTRRRTGYFADGYTSPTACRLLPLLPLNLPVRFGTGVTVRSCGTTRYNILPRACPPTTLRKHTTTPRRSPDAPWTSDLVGLHAHYCCVAACRRLPVAVNNTEQLWVILLQFCPHSVLAFGCVCMLVRQRTHCWRAHAFCERAAVGSPGVVTAVQTADRVNADVDRTWSFVWGVV